MLAKCEHRRYGNNEQVWAGRFKDSQNVPHWHTDCELVTVEYGGARFFVEGKEYYLTAGQSLFIGPGKIHYNKGDKDSVLITFIFDNRLTKNITDLYECCCPALKNKYPIGKIYDEIRREMREKRPYYTEKINQILISLIITIFRGEETTRVNVVKSEHLYRYRKLLEEIDRNYSYFTFQNAADFMGVSTQYFSKTFHLISGMTFSQYLNNVKVEKAVKLLQERSDLSITEVASMCGFSSIRSFNRVFKKMTGWTPSDLPYDYSITNLQPIDNKDAYNPTDKRTVLME